MNTITTYCPAKINLYLDIVGKRSDNYHNLETLMVPISLTDTLTVTKLSENDGIKYKDNINLPFDSNNSLFKVFKQVNSIFPEITFNLSIELTKSIPQGAGLGGGSSDAAYFLKTLISLYDLQLSFSDQFKILTAVGADVPFFLECKPAWCTGIGDIITPLRSLKINNSLHVVLVYPGISVSTIWAYRQMSGKWLTLHQENAKKKRLNCALDIDLDQFVLLNSFESVVFSEFPLIQDIKNVLMSCGTTQALMTGSGSCVFGLFYDEKKATHAVEHLKRLYPMSSAWLAHLLNT